MKRLLLFLTTFAAVSLAIAQKPRPDAFPPVYDTLEPKEVLMATTIEEMYQWNRYPTYDVYLAMMQHFVDTYPTLCHLDTIGTSVQGRLILSLVITGDGTNSYQRPEFFYSSTIHGDEVTGTYLMLRLCDSLLSSYGSSDFITRLLDKTIIYINPLSNPDGTYHGGDNTVARAWRYNANYVDLNRNYPDPFGTDPLDSLQVENQAMIAYVDSHNFLLSANIHGGSEVLNYPWDSFTSSQRPNEHSDWWKEVCKRFVDTCRAVNSQLLRDVTNRGYIAGGDWYVIHNGRQDYFNYYNNLREVTMELYSSKTTSANLLDEYWRGESQALINFIDEIHHIENPTEAIPQVINPYCTAYPNPTRGPVTIQTQHGCYHYDLTDLPAGVHILHVEGLPVKIIKL